MPAHYRSVLFWTLRILVAMIGGGLTLAYGIENNKLLAANIGAATPLIIQALASGLHAPRGLESVPGAPLPNTADSKDWRC